MAIPVGDRTECKFELELKARALVLHTMTVLDNPELFPEKYQNTLYDRMLNYALDAYTDIQIANEIAVKMDSAHWVADWSKRRALQKEAIYALKRLSILIQICYKKFHLKGRKVSYWSGMVSNVRNGAIAWNNSDAKRYTQTNHNLAVD